MKKNLLFVLGTAAILASCSNDETTNSREVIVPKSDVAVSLGAESNIAIEQTRQLANIAAVPSTNKRFFFIFIIIH